MIRLVEASVRFGQAVAVDRFTGSFPSGRITALVGGDGGGKSSLLRGLAGLAPLSPPPRPPVAVGREVGYQGVDQGVWLDLSVQENVEFVSRVYGLSGPRERARADDLLDRAGLTAARDRVARRLSGGMRHKLGFVLATLHRPSLVLLDEPTTGIDPVSRDDLWALIAGAAAEGATIVLATTYLDEAERAGQVFLLDAGRVLAAGTPAEVVAQMPGSLWRNAAGGARPEAVSGAAAPAPWTWRRGRTTYLWTPERAFAGSPGLAPATPDLENASVALLLASERALGRAEPVLANSPNGIGGGAGGKQTPSQADPLVLAERVTRTYGAVMALADVSLRVERGQIVGLVGGNGAGKTTLMRIILGTLAPTGGACALFGATPSLETRRRVGYVAQGLGLYPSLSVIDNFRFAARVHGVPVGSAAADFATGLGATPVGKLPLGARRLAAYVAASQHDPDLLILDEPSSGMDPLSRARLWKELRAQAERGVGVLVTTHYLQEAAQCDRVVMLEAGRVVAT
ncbi:MAG: ATP-binding cassette domain-containing protein [Bifidobacteriaceae bacterium]|jgi:ABC-2 type transport system ATP-binding protein|nr:ATP-binding cassette domain-containing protein [Bifidobacteriaceae bacterium]